MPGNPLTSGVESSGCLRLDKKGSLSLTLTGSGSQSSGHQSRVLQSINKHCALRTGCSPWRWQASLPSRSSVVKEKMDGTLEAQAVGTSRFFLFPATLGLGREQDHSCSPTYTFWGSRDWLLANPEVVIWMWSRGRT